MEPGNQVMLVVINNGVIVQHPLKPKVIDVGEQPQLQRNLAVHKASFNELVAYLRDLDLFQDEA
jgi:hypothetical protein